MMINTIRTIINSPMTQLDIFDFSVHKRERTEEGTLHVQQNAIKFSGDCKKLIQFWQQRWYWLSNEDGRAYGISSYTSARVKDLRYKGILIEDVWDDGIKRFRLKCTCRHVSGELHQSGCWVHDEKLKI